jgi:hypothetical protein
MESPFEPGLVAALIAHKELLSLDFVRPSYFPGALSYIVKTCKQYYDQSGEVIRRLRPIILHAQSPCPPEFEPVLWDTVEAVEGAKDHGASLDYMRDALHDYCVKQSLEHLSSQIVRSTPERAVELIQSYNKPTICTKDGTKLFDLEALQAAYSDPQEVLLEYEGKLGQSVGAIRREDFLLICAPPKRGKSWWLLYSAIQSMRQGHKVLYFNLEMAHKLVHRRAWQIYTGSAKDIDIHTRLPAFAMDGEIEYKPIKAPFSYPSADNVQKQKKAFDLMTPGGDLEIVTIPPDQCTLNYIRDTWKTRMFQGYGADVICVDYLDLMAGSGNQSREYRDKVNSIYLGFRSLILELHILGMSASQTGRQTFDGLKTTGMEDVAEDIRKAAHATTIMTLTQTPQDRERMLMRVQPAGNRDNAGGGTCAVLYNYEIGKVYIDSVYENQLPKKRGTKDDENV